MKYEREPVAMLVCPKDNYVILHDNGNEIMLTCDHCGYIGFREEFEKRYGEYDE